MFESNTDFDFDEEIFAKPFECDSTKPESSKRTIETDSSVVETKRPCFDSKSASTPTRSSTFLKALNEDCSNSKSKPLFKPKTSPLMTACQVQLAPQVSICSPMRKVVSRKFPGPAGLLPERRDFKIALTALEEANAKETKQDGTTDMDVVCSQMSVRAFHEGPWERMIKDFRRRDFLPDKYNIAWIKSKAKSNDLINQKAPFLAAIIQNIEHLSLETVIVRMLLKDVTGQIHGMIVQDLYEEYLEFLTVGSVVILKQFSVLTTDNGTNHYLTITANNLVAIYSLNTNNADENNERSSSIQVLSDKNVNVVTIQNISAEDFMKNINDVKCRHKAALLEQRWNTEMDLGNILLNMRSEGSASYVKNKDANGMSGVNFQRTSSKSDIQFASPNRRSLSIRSISSPGVMCDQSNSKNAAMALANINSLKGSSTSVNKEMIGAANPHNQPRFNFKAHANRSNHSELSPPISTSNKMKEFVGFKSETGNRGVSDSQHTSSASSNKLSNARTSAVKCSQISITSDNVEHSAILQNVFEGIDADLLFEDF